MATAQIPHCVSGLVQQDAEIVGRRQFLRARHFDLGLRPRHFELGLKYLQLRNVSGIEARLGDVAQAVGQLQRALPLNRQAARQRHVEIRFAHAAADLACDGLDAGLRDRNLRVGYVHTPPALAADFEGNAYGQALVRRVTGTCAETAGLGIWRAVRIPASATERCNRAAASSRFWRSAKSSAIASVSRRTGAGAGACWLAGFAGTASGWPGNLCWAAADDTMHKPVTIATTGEMFIVWA